MSNEPVMEEVRGEIAIVTGAASGIGRATAELLHGCGTEVIAEDLSPAVEELVRDGLATVVGDSTCQPRHRSAHDQRSIRLRLQYCAPRPLNTSSSSRCVCAVLSMLGGVCHRN